MKPSTMFFEDFQEGQEFISPGRTISEADIVNFAGVSGDYNPIHIDAEFAKKTFFGERIAHGLLILSIASGLLHDLGIIAGSILAFTGLEWKFKKPARIGDTVRGKFKILKTRALKDQGFVIFGAQILNQKDEIIQEGQWNLVVSKKPA